MNCEENSCNKCGRCEPACYDCNFDISVAPFDPTIWNITWCGQLHQVKIPRLAETDTKLSVNYSGATLNYAAEKHTDIITGEQLGSIINVENLRNTNIDYDFDSNCAEFIYHRYGECGEGCKALEDAWTTFALDDEGAKQNQIRYVRGANRYGCPVYLNTPSNTDQYWYGGWRQDLQEFGYYQSKPVDKLPKDNLGNYYVLSQDPNTKQPLLGTIPLDCIVTNIVGNLGTDVFSTWKVQQTTSPDEGFFATFDKISGAFSITWNDWINYTPRVNVGKGTITGKFNWTVSFDIETGNMKYVIQNVTFTGAKWDLIQGFAGVTTRPSIRLEGIGIPSGTHVPVFSKQNYSDSWSESFNVVVPCNQTIVLPPTQSIGPLDFAYIYVDWTEDDEGSLGINFKNVLSGWQAC